MNKQRIEELRKLCDAATTAPWRIEEGGYSGEHWLVGSTYLGMSNMDDTEYVVRHVTTDGVRASELEGDAKTDAEFIAEARTALPECLDELEDMQTKCATYKSLFDGASALKQERDELKALQAATFNNCLEAQTEAHELREALRECWELLRQLSGPPIVSSPRNWWGKRNDATKKYRKLVEE